MARVFGWNSRLRRRSFARKAADGFSRAVAEVLADDESAGREGALQRVDPRVKLVALFSLAVTASLVHAPALLALLYAIGLALAAVSRVGVFPLVRRVWFSAGFFAAVIALPAATSIITPGPVLARFGPVAVTIPGAYGAITLFLRVMASANFALLIALTTRWSDILRGLSALKVPDIFTMTLGLAQRYAVSLLRTVQQMHLAKESRSIGDFPVAEERRWVAGRMAYVVKKSVKMGDDVYDAMLSRGYAGEVRALAPLKTTPRDAVWLAGISLTCAAFLLLNYLMGS